MRARHVLSPARRHGSGRASLAHLTTRAVAFVRSRDVPASARLRLRVDGAHAGARAHAVVVRTRGRTKIVPVSVGAPVALPFGRGVRRVELVLANGGTGYACWRGTALSCRGVALDDGLALGYRATLG